MSTQKQGQPIQFRDTELTEKLSKRGNVNRIARRDLNRYYFLREILTRNEPEELQRCLSFWDMVDRGGDHTMIVWIVRSLDWDTQHPIGVFTSEEEANIIAERFEPDVDILMFTLDDKSLLPVLPSPKRENPALFITCPNCSGLTGCIVCSGRGWVQQERIDR